MGCGRLWSRRGFEDAFVIDVDADYMRSRALKYLISGKFFLFFAESRFADENRSDTRLPWT